MSGTIFSLHLQEIREEAQRASDPDLVTEKIVYIDRRFVQEWNAKKK